MPATVNNSIDGKTISAQEFYAQARVWAAIVRNQAKKNASVLTKGKKKTKVYKTGKKEGKTEKMLRNSIQFNIQHDNKIPECISFKIPIHGIFVEWAVGYGQPRVSGKYVAKNSRVKRTMAEFIDNPIEKNVSRLFDLAAEYWGDEVLVGFFGTKKL